MGRPETTEQPSLTMIRKCKGAHPTFFQSVSNRDLILSAYVVLFSHLPFREVVRCSGEFIMSYVLHMVFHLVFTMYEVAFLFLFHR